MVADPINFAPNLDPAVYEQVLDPAKKYILNATVPCNIYLSRTVCSFKKCMLSVKTRGKNYILRFILFCLQEYRLETKNSREQAAKSPGFDRIRNPDLAVWKKRNRLTKILSK